MYLVRSDRNHWRMLFRWRAPGEMVLVSANPSVDVAPADAQVAYLYDADAGSMAAPSEVAEESSIIESISWTPVIHVRSTEGFAETRTISPGEQCRPFQTGQRRRGQSQHA